MNRNSIRQYKDRWEKKVETGEKNKPPEPVGNSGGEAGHGYPSPAKVECVQNLANARFDRIQGEYPVYLTVRTRMKRRSSGQLGQNEAGLSSECSDQARHRALALQARQARNASAKVAPSRSSTRACTSTSACSITRSKRRARRSTLRYIGQPSSCIINSKRASVEPSVPEEPDLRIANHQTPSSAPLVIFIALRAS